MSRPGPPARVLAAFVVVTLVGTLVAGEIAARAAYAARDFARARSGALPTKYDLAPYEQYDAERPGNYLLRPGFRMTLREALEYKRAAGHTLGLEDMLLAVEHVGARPDDVIFEVNRAGYKGPELDPEHRRPRVLAVGDSCTFGSLLDAASYPRALERALAARGVPAEVVNAGLGGYHPKNALARLGEFQALRPELTLVYIGWNALYGETPPPAPGLRNRIQILRLARTLFTMWRQRDMTLQEKALENVSREKRPDPADLRLASAAAWQASFLPEVREILVGMQRSGSRPVLVTIPGLFHAEVPPTPEALRIGHLPSSLDNPLVMAVMTRSYNESLRRLAGELGVPLVDLDAWSVGALVPRHAFFIDNVHLTPLGQQRLGEYLAEQLAPQLAALRS